MKKINKDYISVVRNHSGKLHYERVPMRTSDKVKSRLAAMADDDSKSIDDMKEYLSGQPIFKYMAAAYFEAPESINFSSLASWKMKDLADELRNSRTKVKFLENALNLIEESDYRWNVIRITGDMPDVILKSHSDSDSVVITVRVTEDTCIVFDSDDIEDFYSGILCYTVYKNDIPVLPYRSLVEMYRCSEDILDAIRSQRFYATQGPALKVLRDGNVIKVECSECVRISVLSNLVWTRERAFRGEGLTYAEHTLRDDERWIRVEVRDAEGREAWSNILTIQ
jgi:hypothetical protein